MHVCIQSTIHPNKDGDGKNMQYENLLPMIRFDFNDSIHYTIKNNLLHYHLNLDGISLALVITVFTFR